MRMIVIKQATDLQQISSRLAGKSGAESALATLKTFNPHLADVKKIEAGAVIFVPESPSFKTAESDSVEGDAFDDLAQQLQTSVNAASDQVQQGWSALIAEEKDVSAAFKLITSAKRAADVDAALKAQIDAATQLFKQDQTTAKSVGDSLSAMETEVEAELAEIAKLMR